MNFREFNILGNIIDDTYADRSGNGAFKITSKITGQNTMQITTMIVVNLLNRSEMQKEADKSFDQLNKACNEFLKETKKLFKAQAGRTLKTKEIGHQSNVELINMSAYSPKGTALVRCTYNFEIS